MASLWLRGSEPDWAFSARPLGMPTCRRRRWFAMKITRVHPRTGRPGGQQSHASEWQLGFPGQS
eukprot:1612146-Prymnesium_polylepis.1